LKQARAVADLASSALALAEQQPDHRTNKNEKAGQRHNSETLLDSVHGRPPEAGRPLRRQVEGIGVIKLPRCPLSVNADRKMTPTGVIVTPPAR
jgi:hypothetical protein